MQKRFDITGIFFKYLRNLELLLSSKIWSTLSIAQCWVRGIKIGKNCIFHGLSIFYRRPESTINIGSNCVFRSSQRSNLIGINRKCVISTQEKGAVINIGINCGFSGTVIGAFKRITIGNNVLFGANTLVTDSDWHSDDPRSGPPMEVVIGNNVWLGVNSVVLKGVTIGENSVIGANSVVTKSIPANVIAAGNPCKVIRSLLPE